MAAADERTTTGTTGADTAPETAAVIFILLRQLYVTVRDLFIPQEKHAALYVRPIDENEPCPLCGHKDGCISAVPDERKQKWRLKHNCKKCGFWWVVDAVADRAVEG